MALLNPYCTVAEAQAECQNSDSDDARALMTAVNRASREIDAYCQRDFLFHDATVSPLVIPMHWCVENVLFLPWPVLSLNSVTLIDSTNSCVLDPREYRVEPSYGSGDGSKIYRGSRWMKRDSYSATGLLPHRLYPLQNQVSLLGTFGYTNAGIAQVEAATAVGVIGTSGNAIVTVTGANLTGSPIALPVAVSSGDAAPVWAAKVQAVLAANPVIAALYTASVNGAQVILTGKVDSAGVVLQNGDTTLNIALANGTCTGITPAPASVTTRAGTLLNPEFVPDTIPAEIRQACTVLAAIRSGKYRKDVTDFGGNRTSIVVKTIPKEVTALINRHRVPII